MKTNIILSLSFVLAIAVSGGYAQELTLTTTNANTVSSKSSIDLPGLTGNPLAIIVATPLGNTELLNTHPIGAWYYSGKWNIFNSDHAVMPIGAKYKVEFVLTPNATHFMHFVTQQNLGSEGSYIDNPGLNNNPGAQVKILQNYAPEVRTPYNLNRFESKVAFSSAAGRWYIANTNGEPIGRGCVFNIVISSASGSANPNPANPGANTPPSTTGNTSVPPNTNPITQPIVPITIGTIPKVGQPVKVPGPPEQTPPIFQAPQPVPVVTNQPPKTPGPTPIPTPVPVQTPLRLNGFVDMHTHPMSHLGFGKKLMHGAPDPGSIIPAGTRNCNQNDYIAHDILDALGNCNSSHGGWDPIKNPCGDNIRGLVITNLFDSHFVHRFNPFSASNSFGDHRHEGIESNPQFLYAPHQTSKVHQQMWWEWIKRAKEEGNLRVMVALAVNSELLAEILNSDDPKNDRASADLQVDEIKSFVKRHDDFMEVAYTSADLRRINAANKLAVILGVEIDNIGDFNKPGVVTENAVKDEIRRLYYVKGVRYIFPIHLLDNKFGGTAVYSNLFNIATKHATGNFYQVESSTVQFRLGVSPIPGGDFAAIQGITATLDASSGMPYPPAFNGNPGSPGFCPVPVLGCWKTFRTIRSLLTPDPAYLAYNSIPGGHVNKKGLSDLGKVAVLEMMKLGMLIDIDHMSDRSQNDTLAIAERSNNDYPVNIGHNGIRGQDSSLVSSERHASITSVQRVAALGGVFGVGTADTDSAKFIGSFNSVWTVMGNNPRVAMGTDVNGMEPLPKVLPGLNSNVFYTGFPRSITGSRAWDYTTEGVAHYGMMADFMKDVREKDLAVYQRLMDSAEYFAQMWEKVERQKTRIQ